MVSEEKDKVFYRSYVCFGTLKKIVSIFDELVKELKLSEHDISVFIELHNDDELTLHFSTSYENSNVLSEDYKILEKIPRASKEYGFNYRIDAKDRGDKHIVKIDIYTSYYTNIYTTGEK